MGMTPHAPCTPNCTQNAPAASPLKLDGRIQSGINAPLKKTKMIIVSLRPMYCDTDPAMAPPLEERMRVNAKLAEVTVRDAHARDSTAVADDSGDDGVAIVEALGLLEVGRVQILRAMGKEVET
jgi:hypothetical protein